MIGELLTLVLGATPRIYLAVDRPFVPDQPGSIVRVEIEGSHTIDIRLYELRDPGKYLSSSAGNAAPAPAGPSPGGVRAATDWRAQERAKLLPLLTPTAQAALHLLAPAEGGPSAADPPFLRGEKLLRRWTLPCGVTQEHSYCDVDLGPIPAGVYLVEGIAGGEAAYAAALSTRLALTLRRLPGQLVFATSDSQTGEVWPNVQVEVTGPGGAEQRGTTGPQGTLALKPTTRHVIAVAHSGSDWAQLDADYFSHRTHGPRLWLTTDRGEARPGEAVRFVGIERPPPGAAREIPISLEDGRGTSVATVLAHEDDRGLFTGFVDVPEGIALGGGHLVADLGTRVGTGELDLRDPAVPELAATVAFMGAGQARVQVSSPAGPVGARGDWHLLRTPLQGGSPLAPSPGPGTTEIVGSGDFATEVGGTAVIPLPEVSSGDARLRLEIGATDVWGRRTSCVAEKTVLAGPWHLEVEPDRRIYAPTEAAHLTLAATDASGHPGSGSVVVRVTDARIGPNGEPQSVTLPAQTIALDAHGHGELSLPNLRPGYYEVEARSGKVPLAEAVFFVTSRGGDIPYTPDALTLLTDRDHYQPGDTARVLVLAPFEAAAALVTAETSEVVHEEEIPIRASSALTQIKIPAATGLTVAASAIFGGQSYAGEVTVPVGPSGGGLHLEGSVVPASAPGLVTLAVHAHDGTGRPLSGIEVVATWRDADAEAPLGPPAPSYLDPPPTREGQTDVSLDFHRTGYSHGTAADRLDHLRADLGPLEGFTPQKGQLTTPPRPLHSTAGGLERLPLTDRAGSTQLTLPLRDAQALEVDLVGVGTPENGKAPPVAETHLRYDSPSPYVIPLAPVLLRPDDEAKALVDAHNLSGTITINGVPTTSSGQHGVDLDFDHPSIDVSDPGPLLRLDIPTEPDPTWRLTSIAWADSRHPVRISPGSAAKVRLATGTSGLLALLDTATPAVAEGAFERHGGSVSSGDEALSALALALARESGPEVLAPRVAAVVAALLPDGTLPPSPVEDGDPARTAVACHLLDAAGEAGAEAPSDWLDRVHASVERAAARSTPYRALSLWALGGGASAPAELLAADVGDRLSSSESAALALAMDARRQSEAAAVATRIEHRSATAGGRACWTTAGCDPAEPPTAESLAATSLSAMALAHLRPQSPRIPEALRYLADARSLPVARRGLAGALLALAVADIGKLSAEGPARATISGGPPLALAPGEFSEVDLGPAGGVVRVSPGSAWIDVLKLAPAASSPGGALRVERRWWSIDLDESPPERIPLDGSADLGEEVWVELTVSGAKAGQAVHIEDPYPGGLVVSEQPETQGPLAQLEHVHGQIAFAPDRVIIDVKAGAQPLVVGYLARAMIEGDFHAPAAVATAGEERGESSADELEIGVSP